MRPTLPIRMTIPWRKLAESAGFTDARLVQSLSSADAWQNTPCKNSSDQIIVGQ